MMPLEVKTLAAVGDGAYQDGLPWPVIVMRLDLGKRGVIVGRKVQQIENRGGEMPDGAAFLVRDISGHGQGLEVNFRSHYRGAEVEQHAAFKRFHGFREDQKIAVRGFAEHCAVAIRVLVDDVIADADMDCGGNAQPPGGSIKAHVTMRKSALLNGAADCATHAEPVACAGPERVVNPTGLLPQPELSFLNIPPHILRRFANQGHLEIVNRARAVSGKVRDYVPLHELDDEARATLLDHMRAHHQDDRIAVLARLNDAINELRKVRMIE